MSIEYISVRPVVKIAFMDDLTEYDYELPQELIASVPLPERDASRLLVVDRQSGELAHRAIRDLPKLLDPGDLLVLNDTKVVPARLLGRRTGTGGRWEGLYLQTTSAGDWRLICESRGRLQPGEDITVERAHSPDSGDVLRLTLIERDADGVWAARPHSSEHTMSLLERFGTVPLPPYLRRTLATPEDWLRYQTTYSRRPGAVAAPTAGLHLTTELLDACRRRSIEQTFVTLHVGIGTFRPIKAKRLSEHRMHAEWCDIPDETIERIENTKSNGGRVVAVGTTVVRSLESAAQHSKLGPWQGKTDLFIRPPFEFHAVDALLTNFHLPRSTLLALVSAFAGVELIKRAYAAAIQEKYRFYSYGDAMLIV